MTEDASNYWASTDPQIKTKCLSLKSLINQKPLNHYIWLSALMKVEGRRPAIAEMLTSGHGLARDTNRMSDIESAARGEHTLSRTAFELKQRTWSNLEHLFRVPARIFSSLPFGVFASHSVLVDASPVVVVNMVRVEGSRSVPKWHEADNQQVAPVCEIQAGEYIDKLHPNFGVQTVCRFAAVEKNMEFADTYVESQSQKE